MENAVDTQRSFMAQKASQDLAERPLYDVAPKNPGDSYEYARLSILNNGLFQDQIDYLGSTKLWEGTARAVVDAFKVGVGVDKNRSPLRQEKP